MQVKKKKFDNRNHYPKENNGSNALQILQNQLNQCNGKMGRSKITWMSRSNKNYRPYNNGYRHGGGGRGYKKPRYNNDRRHWHKQR